MPTVAIEYVHIDELRPDPANPRRISDPELEAQRQGPRTIGERARIIGGELAVESRPGFGSCVEVVVPLEAAQQDAGRSAAI